MDFIYSLAVALNAITHAEIVLVVVLRHALVVQIQPGTPSTVCVTEFAREHALLGVLVGTRPRVDAFHINIYEFSQHSTEQIKCVPTVQLDVRGAPDHFLHNAQVAILEDS